MNTSATPDVASRGLPSVNDSRLRRNRLSQVLLIFFVIAVIGLIGVLFVNHMRDLLRPKPSVVEPPSKASKMFDELVSSLPPPPAPPMPAASQLPPPPPPEAPANANPNLRYRMMLTDTGGQQGANIAPVAAALSNTANAAAGPGSAFKSPLQQTSTPRSQAGSLGDRNVTLARGSTIDCILNTRLDSTVPGMTSCTVSRNVYSDNGKVVLVERGSQMTGEYGSTLSNGQQRIHVLWDRIKTTNGVTIAVNSPGADELGGMGIPGFVDNHWPERIGAAMLVSVIQDAIEYKMNSQGASNGGAVIVLPENSVNATKRLPEKILDSTINIAPTLHRNHGERISIFVARDLDFGSMYELHAK